VGQWGTPELPTVLRQTANAFRYLKSPLVESVTGNHAREFHKRITSMIQDYDASLDQAHEVGLRLVSFGQSVVFRLTGIGYWNPSLISFTGFTDEGKPVTLIQHVSHISILLTTLERRDPSTPKRPIGFAPGQEE
jgi:hypothetical protein